MAFLVVTVPVGTCVGRHRKPRVSNFVWRDTLLGGDIVKVPRVSDPPSDPGHLPIDERRWSGYLSR